jgi:CO/xanthine dehydrogenase Mo-binding subunit
MTKVETRSDKLVSNSNYKYVGKNCERIDARDIVTGKAIFLDDYTVKDALFCAVLKSPVPHADITSIDTSAAKALPGVHAVLTYEDCDPSWGMGEPPMKPILGKRVHFAGDGVAIVAADTAEIANEALELIKVEYEELEAVYNPVEAVKDGAPQLYDREDIVNNIVPGGSKGMQPDGPWYHIERGDIDKGFEECEFIAEDFVEFAQKPTPLPPESPGVIAKWENGDNYLVYGTSQSNFIMTIQNETVIPGFRVHAKSFNVGGSYGSKNALVIPCQYCCMLSKATKGRPVKWIQSKTEHFVIHETRLGSQIKAKMGCDKDGIIHAVQGVWDVDCGCFCSTTQGQVSVGLGEAQLFCGQAENWDLLSNCVVTNKNSAGVVRGYGGQELNACLSLLMTRVMREANVDPVESFKKNYIHGGQKYIWRDGRYWTCDPSINYDKAIDEAARKFRWKDRWKGWGVPTYVSPDGRIKRGIGLSICGNADVGESWTEGFVHVLPRITEPKSDIVLQMDVTESGMGQRSNVCKQVAEILNVPYEMVKITDPDNMFNGTNTGLCGSRGTITCGRAAVKAAQDVAKQLIDLAAPILHVETEFLELYNFGVRSKSRPELWVPWNALVPQFCTLTGFGRHVENFSTPSCLVTFIEAEVDTWTGLVKVVDILNGSDAGQIIDPAALEMQMQGAIGSASLDTALYEESIIDPATGRLLSCNMIDYKWRPFNEFPPFSLSVTESKMDTYYFKAVGIGENAGAGAASACMMAISNAIGVDIKRYPATPDVVLEALGKVEK